MVMKNDSEFCTLLKADDVCTRPPSWITPEK